MAVKRYEVNFDASRTVYEFYSEGPKGRIRKKVSYSEMDNDIFNLSFGDVFEARKPDDTRRSDNGDKDKVLMTVAHTVFKFLDAYPGSRIYFEGSTASRTRLYQMEIAKWWNEISLGFDVQGRDQEDWVPFERNRNFTVFLIGKK